MGKSYEHLLSRDPIGALEKIKEDYVRYFSYAFRINNKELNDERIEKLKEHDNLYKDPYLEILPEYKTAEGITSIMDLAGDKELQDAFGNPKCCQQFFDFISKGLMNYAPYGHQVEMLKKAFVDKKNVVITSGTGSGKTESFLLPLLAEIYKEAKSKWGNAQYTNARPNNTYWFQAGRYEPCQRKGESRTAALRALVLYPMNALVEDQMARLRKALDSDSVRDHFNNNLGRNKIYFGRYIGSTIGKKGYEVLRNWQENNKTTDDFNGYKRNVHDELVKIHNQYIYTRNYYDNLSDEEKRDKQDALFVGPRLETDDNKRTSEMITRWDMQVTPPDIMITNTSMLSIMLMRSAEESIFVKTKEWLKADPSHVFHLIVDELHLYRGTQGSEVSCLLKMLLDRIGLKPVIKNNEGQLIPNPQLRILASSASLGDENATMKYLEEFFGVYSDDPNSHPSFKIQKGSDYNPMSEARIDYSKFAGITPDFLEKEDYSSKREYINNFISNQFQCDSIEQFIELYQETIFCNFTSSLNENRDGSRCPICYTDLYGDGKLFPNESALRGFLIFRGFLDEKDDEGNSIRHRLPRFRFHQFFKYIEGLWGELNPTVGNENANSLINLTYIPNEVGPNNHKILELLRCECCGELFLGGNRNIQGENLSLTLNYPDLSRIPNFNPTPMVQNKSFEEYALFWPTNDDEVQGQNDNDKRHVALLQGGRGDTDFGRTGAKSIWRHGYLNVNTGNFSENDDHTQSQIKGFLFDLEAYNNGFQSDKIKAMPCCCPKCGQNYKSRKYAKSPIRSFRAGMGRSNQLLSKGLIYQLSEKSNKLIGFSDSREDAASQAYEIELEHYRDMVRSLFVDCVTESIPPVQDILVAVQNMRNAGARRNDVRNRIRTDYGNVPNINDLVNDVLDIMDGEQDEDILDKYKYNVNLESFVDNNGGGKLVSKLVKLGINPAGVDYKNEFYTTGTGRNEESHHWSEAYDFNNGTLLPVNLDATFRDNVKNSIISAVYANSFGKYMGVSTIDSGIGYICCRRDATIEDSREYRNLNDFLSPLGISVYDFVDTYIRILGDNYRYDDPNSIYPTTDYTSYDEFSRNLKSIISKFAELNRINEDRLGECLFQFLYRFISGPATKLIFGRLAFHYSNGNEPYYECPNCHRVHLSRGMGICTNTNCLNPLNDQSSGCVQDLWSGNFISYDIFNEPRKPKRLHTAELTGQTDNIQERLLQFKNLILLDPNREGYRRGYERSKCLDMVNVTTTMEVGVDIGSLEAIFQGNMPPTRYNYQQRVGRGGRRGQAFSAAFTCCRGRSHDTYYYYKGTAEMLGSTPTPPSLSLAPFRDQDGYKMKLSIMKRVIIKNILHDAFKEIIPCPDPKLCLVDNAGEFGFVSEWNVNSTELSNWIQGHPQNISDTVHYYFDQFNRNGIDISGEINMVIDWISNNLVQAIDNTVNRCANQSMGLAQCLSEYGFLPLYGLPSDVRLFYHGYDNDNQKLKKIDRSLELSITEFAPGSERTKDKGKYRVEEITIPMNDDYSFIGDNQDALSERYTLNFAHDINGNDGTNSIIGIQNTDRNQAATDIINQYNGRQRMVVIPLAYRSNQIRDNRGDSIENNERKSAFSQSIIYTETQGLNQNDEQGKSIENVRITVFGNKLDETSNVWHINTNNNYFYKGRYISHNNMIYSGFTFYDNRERITRGADTFDIALGARKATEMIKLQLINGNTYLDLNVNSGNRSAIRAAFYSAAFLIQRTLADKLDVQPDEIEISEKLDEGIPIIYLSDALPNGAGLVSYLYQEDHLKDLLTDIIEFRTNFMQSLISDDHRQECLTACQKCLKTYTNRGFHHVLDWRLGIGIIRLMMNPDYDFGFTESDNDYPELLDEERILTIAARKLGLAPENAEQDGHIWRQNGALGQSRCWMIYHPLWNREQAKMRFCPNDSHIQMYNTFKLLRSDVSRDNTDAPRVNSTPTTVATTPVTTTNQATQANQIVGGINLSD